MQARRLAKLSEELEDAPAGISFPKTEEATMQFWEEVDAFKNQLRQSEGKPEYSFYDGPPFATGSPHYGHILAGTIKDVRTRFAHQTGFHVPRNFGWDTHGMPIEFEVDKMLGIKGKQDVLDMGIEAYNAKCRSIVMRCEEEWKQVVPRMGRWIDFEGGYKTMDTSYMESVWWVFKTLFDKGLVYRGFKVMPYSMACATPISNFEKDLNYQDVNDPAVVVTFPLVDEPETAFVAWTTTPWTLPSNLALCVHPDLEYVKIKENASGTQYWLMEARTSQLYKDTGEFTILEKCTGKALKGKKYKPLFDYFAGGEFPNAFQVCNDTYVTADSGTGIVHQAPAFGEDDMRVCLDHNIIIKGGELPCPINSDGCFIEPICNPEFGSVGGKPGLNVKDADKHIIKLLRSIGRLASESVYHHSYPFCWRSDTPLIYRAVPSWFVKVESFRDKLVANNDKTYWVPEAVRANRFNNWLANANDWNIGRTRFWGTPLPLWANDDFSEMVAIGSIAELKEYSGVEVTDLHRETVDGLTWIGKQGKKMERIEEVFDCWFESGSMPYGQAHYPFENKERFEATFPADFIAEGLDQTRGWFYTLMVLSTALFDQPAFKNNIVNGIVKAEDGKKMSKRLKNYPSPVVVVDSHGADALRLYLINSPVVRAQDLSFKEAGVKGVVRDVLLPWYNAYRFFVQSARRFPGVTGKAFLPNESIATTASNQMDCWLLASLQTLIKTVHVEIGEKYKLYNVAPPLVAYLDQITNWYLRLNRDRLKGDGNTEKDWHDALSTTYTVLLNMCIAMAPVTPFIVEHMFQNLKRIAPKEQRVDSVHYLMMPQPIEGASNPAIESAVQTMQNIINGGRKVREQQKKSMKQPLKECVIVAQEHQLAEAKQLEEYIKSELNVGACRFEKDDGTWVVNRLVPNFAKLGKKLGKDMPKVKSAIMSLDDAKVQAFIATGSMEVEGYTLVSEEVEVSKNFKGESDTIKGTMSDGDILVLLDTELSADLMKQGLAREWVNRVQKLRKSGGLAASDRIEVFYEPIAEKKNAPAGKAKKGGKGAAPVEETPTPGSVVAELAASIGETLRTPAPSPASAMQAHVVVLAEEVIEIDEQKFKLSLARRGLGFKVAEVVKAAGGDQALADDTIQMLTGMDYGRFAKEHKAGSIISCKLGDGVDGAVSTVNLQVGKSVFLSVSEASRS